MHPPLHHFTKLLHQLLPVAPLLQAVQEDDFGTGFFAPMQKHLWNLFENPDHSKAAKVTAYKSSGIQISFGEELRW